MNDILILNGQEIAYEDIKAGKVAGNTDFEEATLLFCRQWLNGQASFSLKTSGSTGTPKEIKVSREQMLASARQTINYFNLVPADSVLVCLNTAYIAGIMMLVRGFVAESKIIAVEPKANPLLDIEQKVDFLAVVPLQLEEILTNDATRDRLDRIRATIVGGAPVSYLLQKDLSRTAAQVWATFGMTETLTHFALRQLNPILESTYTAFDETTISMDNKGCLVVSSAVTNGEELVTNDLVELKSLNEFEWVGRIDNVINSGGVKLQLELLEKKAQWMMVEQQLNYNFFIAAAPDKKLGQQVELVIEGEEDEQLYDKIPWEDYFERFEKPRRIIFMPRFVYTPTGKINRKATIELRNLWA
jgi:O-succinylbenzoic acid--CoA ligase